MPEQETIQPEFEELLEFLKQNRNFDFTGYKRASLMRRVDKRLQSIGVASYTDYMDYLEVHQEEFTHLFNTILINVTTFFRDTTAWAYITESVIPTILQAKGSNAPIRVWSAGCASGEEAYTIAILLAEALGEEEFRARVKIYATDLDEEALNVARHGAFTQKHVAGIPEHLLEKYFDHTDDIYVFRKEYRRSVIFGRHDLIQNAPISRIDLLICRNLLMYFSVETQARILNRFHYALNDHGFLFLGRAEMLFMHTRSFTPVDLKRRVFAKAPRFSMRDRLMSMAQDEHSNGSTDLTETRLHEEAFGCGVIPQIVIDPVGNLSLANENARKLLALGERDLGRPLREFEFSYRHFDLNAFVNRVQYDGRPITEKEIEWNSSNGDHRWYDIHLVSMIDPANGSMIGLAISFVETTQYRKLQQDLQNVNQEMEVAYEELQSTNEELETTNEELQSTVEELETTNEELQSTNEELETMNEELQATNEELHSTNDTLFRRSRELNQVNAFLESILTSLRMAVIVLDREMLVQIWNSHAEELWGLSRREVMGQHLMNLDFGLPAETLRAPIRACINGEANLYETIISATNRRGRAIHCQISCTPLRGYDAITHGVILLIEATAGQTFDSMASTN